MASIVPGFEYDIFISYRHNDNRSGWVTEFVNALQEELAATIKEPLAIYFDKNPHDGLLETHNVDKSLEGKLKCLIFIPIISQTYCDTKSFAWQHEFCAFNKLSKEDQFGRDIKLSNGNVASRILPIKIHDLDVEDKTTIENEIGGLLRAIDFIYREAGVNRPLKAGDDRHENLNKTDYRNQVNKVANAIKELIAGIQHTKDIPKKGETINSSIHKPSRKKITSIAAVIAVLGLLSFGYYYFGGFGNKIASEIDPSIAVLAFTDMSPNHDQEYFSDGLSDELITVLSKVPELKVIARTSAFWFKGKNEDARTIGEKLGVAHLLLGSIQKSGNKLRVSVQLVKVGDGSHLWSETYNRDMDEIFKVQDEIAEAVVMNLKIAMLGTINSPPVSNNMEAYNLLLQGKYIMARNESGYHERAMEKFKQALAIDGNDAKAWAGISNTYCGIAWKLEPTYERMMMEARKAAEKAIALNDLVADGHSAMGEILFMEWKWKEAEVEFKKAYAIKPELYRLSELYKSTGRLEEAIKLNREAVRIDPVNAKIFRDLSVSLYYSGKLDDALIAAQRCADISPHYGTIQYTIGNIYLLQQRPRDAIAEYEKEGLPNFRLSGLAMAYFAADNRNKSDSILNQLIQQRININNIDYHIARIFAFRGEKDKAFKLLEECYVSRLPSLVQLKNDPFMKGLEGDSRHTALLKKMNLPLD